MEEKKNLLTYAGLKKLEDELHDLKVVKRKEVAGKIKEAREQGDLSENAEYDAAKDEQRDIEARIEEIEKILKNAEVVVEDEVDLDKINVGCKVKVHDYEFDEDMELKIVGSTEANSLEGKISNESPVVSARQNLQFLAGIRRKIGKKEIDEAIRKVGLDPEAKKHVGKYSLGMRQRLGIAQAIMEEPSLLILDEPMNGLDNQGVQEMRQLFLKLKEEGKTILLASHNREDIAALCDTTVEIDRGKITKTRT